MDEILNFNTQINPFKSKILPVQYLVYVVMVSLSFGQNLVKMSNVANFKKILENCSKRHFGMFHNKIVLLTILKLYKY